MQNLLIGFFDAIGNFLNSILPNLGDSGLSGVSDSIQTIVKFIAGADYFIPVETIFQITGIVMGYYVFVIGLWVFNWVVKLIRG